MNPRNGLVFENQVVRGDHPLYSGGPSNSPFVTKQFATSGYTFTDVPGSMKQIDNTPSANLDVHYGPSNPTGGRLRFDGNENSLASDIDCPEHNGVDCDETYPARRTRTNSPMGIVQREKITGAGFEVTELATGQVGEDANGISYYYVFVVRAFVTYSFNESRNNMDISSELNWSVRK